MVLTFAKNVVYEFSKLIFSNKSLNITKNVTF